MADSMALIPGYGAIREWYTAAVPALSQYLVIPDARSFFVRLKADSPLNGDGINHVGGHKVGLFVDIEHQLQHRLFSQIYSYLGHRLGAPVWPMRTGLQWTADQSVETKRLPNPRTENGKIIADIKTVTKQVSHMCSLI